jgi:hypothetical protein
MSMARAASARTAYRASVTHDGSNGRRRAVALALAAVTVALGLASRRHGPALPEFVAAYAGDTLWALLVYLLATAAAPGASVTHRAAGALAFAFAIETSQLYHAAWIDAIRGTRLGALVLGSGFLWSDFACYAAGDALGAATEASLAHRSRSASAS